MKILFILFLIPVAYGWGCDAHKYICEKAGYGDYNCCIADNRDFQRDHKFTSSYYHHCKDNSDSCEARRISNLYLNGTDKKEVYLHLLADSMTPVHWFSTEYSKCHGPFEDAVDSNIGKLFWKVEYLCELKNGSVFKITMDQKYLDDVASYIKNYTAGLTTSKESNYLKIEDCTDRKCMTMMPYIKEILYFIFVVIAFLLIKYFPKNSPIF